MKKLTFDPLHDEIIVKIEDKEEDVIGGIIIPTVADKPVVFAEVMACGPGTYRGSDFIPMPVEKGERVVLRDIPHERVYYEGQECRLVKSFEIIGRNVREQK